MAPPTVSPAIGSPPDRRRCRSALWVVVQYGVAVFLTSLTLSLLVKPWVRLSLWAIFRRCASIGAALGLWVFICKRERRSLRSYGFSIPGAGKRQLPFGVLLGVGALGLMFGLGLMSGACRLNVTTDHLKLWRTVLGFIPAALLVGLLEELVFRGFILQHLLTCSKTFGVIASSALYALVHLRERTLDLATWRELSGLFLLGGVLALSVLLTHQLYLAVGLHASLAYGARVNKLLIEFPDPSLAWLVGTNRLINGVASWIALLAIGAVMVWWVRSSHGGGEGHEHAH